MVVATGHETICCSPALGTCIHQRTLGVRSSRYYRSAEQPGGNVVNTERVILAGRDGVIFARPVQLAGSHLYYQEAVQAMDMVAGAGQAMMKVTAEAAQAQAMLARGAVQA
jgi:hypothetical protein